MIDTEWIDRVFDLSEIAAMDLADQAVLLRDLKALITNLSVVRGEIEGLMYERLDGKPVTVEGVGTIVPVTQGHYKSWRGQDLINTLAAQVADEVVDRETGEYPPLSVVTQLAMEVLAECSGANRPSNGWRATALKARGISPSEYANYEGGGRRYVDIR